MNTKLFLGVTAAVLVVVGGYFFFAERANAPAPTSYSWKTADKTVDQSRSKTELTLVADGKEHVIGTFDGTCAEQDSDYLPNEKSKVVCWFAGGGKEVGLFVENGKWVVKIGDLDEGDAETGGFRGNFQTALSL